MSGDTFRKSTAREYFESIVIAVILALFVRTWVVQAFKIPTGSMEENLLIGDHLLVNKFVYAPSATGLERALLPMGDVERGDVLVFKFPEDPERDFIKRVIGLPGETIEGRQGRVYIDGEAIDEPWLELMRPDGRLPLDIRSTFGPTAIPEGHLFMMGQPRRLRGQPLLGAAAGGVHQGPGVHCSTGRTSPGATSTPTSASAPPCSARRRPLLHPHPLGPPVHGGALRRRSPSRRAGGSDVSSP